MDCIFQDDRTHPVTRHGSQNATPKLETVNPEIITVYNAKRVHQQDSLMALELPEWANQSVALLSNDERQPEKHTLPTFSIAWLRQPSCCSGVGVRRPSSVIVGRPRRPQNSVSWKPSSEFMPNCVVYTHHISKRFFFCVCVCFWM